MCFFFSSWCLPFNHFLRGTWKEEISSTFLFLPRRQDINLWQVLQCHCWRSSSIQFEGVSWRSITNDGYRHHQILMHSKVRFAYYTSIILWCSCFMYICRQTSKCCWHAEEPCSLGILDSHLMFFSFECSITSATPARLNADAVLELSFTFTTVSLVLSTQSLPCGLGFRPGFQFFSPLHTVKPGLKNDPPFYIYIPGFSFLLPSPHTISLESLAFYDSSFFLSK